MEAALPVCGYAVFQIRAMLHVGSTACDCVVRSCELVVPATVAFKLS